MTQEVTPQLHSSATSTPVYCYNEENLGSGYSLKRDVQSLSMLVVEDTRLSPAVEDDVLLCCASTPKL